MSDENLTLAGGESPAELSPGLLLQAARERAGWTPERLATELCLPVDRLLALEKDEHSAFGGAVFVRGYLRRAGVLLDVSPAELLAAYEASCDTTRPSDVVPRPLPGPPPRRGLPGWLAPAGGVAAAAAALAIGWWLLPGLQDDGAAAGNGSASVPAALEFNIAAEPVLALAPVMDLADEDIAPGESESVAEAIETPTAPVRPDAPAAAATTVDYAESAMPMPGTVELRFEFSQDCWLEVHDADGRRLAYRLHRAGDVSRLRAKAPTEIFLGNADGVRLTVDGAPLALRPAASRDGTVRLTVGGGAG